MKMIETPSGLKDIVAENAKSKYELQRRIETIFERNGYEMVMTPDIEFYQTYVTAYSQTDASEMYKFFDQDGQILTLRTDMTVPIARVVASKYAGKKPPFRFCYTQNVYKVRQALAGKRNQVTDCGIELIGADQTSDCEVLSMALEVMDSLGVSKYTMEIGNSNFFRTACQSAGLAEENIPQLADLVDRKSIVELEEYLDTLQLPKEVTAFFLDLPFLNGSDALKQAQQKAFTQELKDEIAQLQDLEQFLQEIGYGQHISFDLSKAPHLDYYTGIIFEGYVEGVGEAVLSGGRYDDLLKKFGKDYPAIGFGIKVDPIAEVVASPQESITKILYPSSLRKEAYFLAKQLREKEKVALECREEKTEIEVVR